MKPVPFLSLVILIVAATSGRSFGEESPLSPGLIVDEYPRADSQSTNDQTFLEPEDLGEPIGTAFVIESLERWKHGEDRNALASGFLQIEKAGTYHFRTDSFYDRNLLRVDGETVCAFRDGTTASGSIELEPGRIPIEAVGYVNGRGELAGILVEWKPAGAREFSPIPPDRLSHPTRPGALARSPYEPLPVIELTPPTPVLPEPLETKALHASWLTVVAKDFVIEIYHNGRRLTRDERKMVLDQFGSTVEKVTVEVRAGDWLVFHVAHNQLRHDGTKYFAVTGHLDAAYSSFTTRANSEDWSVCDNPEASRDFIRHRDAGTEARAAAIQKPWEEGEKFMEKFSGGKSRVDPIWGNASSTWIKYVAPESMGGRVFLGEPKEEAKTLEKTAKPVPTDLDLAITEPKRWPVQILSATYGTGGKNADVTEKVREYVEEKRAFFAANPRHLGVDPNPGWNKGLRIVFMKDGVRRVQHRNENEHILPESFYGPQDTAELTAWITGTRWQGPNGEIQFHSNSRLAGPKLTGEADWKSLRANRLQLIWPNEKEPVEYQFDHTWSSFRIPDDGKNEYRIVK